MSTPLAADIGLSYLFGLMGLGALVIAGFFFFEAWALITNHVPITEYVRTMTTYRPKPLFAALAMIFLGLGILLGHFWA